MPNRDSKLSLNPQRGPFNLKMLPPPLVRYLVQMQLFTGYLYHKLYAILRMEFFYHHIMPDFSFLINIYYINIAVLWQYLMQ